MKRNVPPKTEKNESYELRPHATQGVKEKKKLFTLQAWGNMTSF